MRASASVTWSLARRTEVDAGVADLEAGDLDTLEPAQAQRRPDDPEALVERVRAQAEAPRSRYGIEPAAHAWGWQATGYGTGSSNSARGKPANSSGSR